MSKRDLFRLVIKLAGMYFLFVMVLPSLVSSFSFLTMNGSNSTSMLAFIIGVLILVGIFVLMVFGPDLIINFFRLDKGFDTEDVDLKKYKLNDIVLLAVILLGGTLIINNLPNLLSNLLFAFKSMVQQNIYQHLDKQSNIKIVVNILFILIGYLMISKRAFLVRLLTPKKADDE